MNIRTTIPAKLRVETPGFCTLCRSRCGSLNVVEDGRLVAVKPLPSHPTGKALCSKGRAAPEVVHNARRLQTPLIRTNSKTAADPGWRRISWDEALDHIAAKLRAIADASGPEAVAFGFTSPSASSISDSLPWLERFVWTFGSPNICWSTELCNWHKDHGHEFTFGTGMPVPDYRNSELIVLWGHNPATAWLAQAEAIGEGRSKGARLVVIDPRKTAFASDADLWLQLKPGSDGVLALAVARLLVEQDRYDETFVRRWTNAPFLVRTDTGRFLRASDVDLGDADTFVTWDTTTNSPVSYDPRRAFDPAHAAVAALDGEYRVGANRVTCRPAFALYRDQLRDYTLDRAARETGVAAGKIRAFADAIAGAGSLCYYGWTGIGQHGHASQIDRAIATLFALKGQYDAPGGNVWWASHPVPPVSAYAMLAPEQRAKAIGLERLPLGPPSRGWITGPDMYRAITDGQPYRIRGLINFGCNYLVAQPDPKLGRRALEQLEFYVHCDVVPNPTSQYADIVLPVNTAWERDGLRVGFEISPQANERIQLRKAVIEPIGEGKPDHWIVAELAKRLGFGALFRDGDFDAAWNDMLAPLGITTQALRAQPEGINLPLIHRFRKYADENGDAVAGFNTPTRRVELYSEQLQRHGYPPLPQPLPSMATSEQFPITLTTAKNGHFCHSQQRGIASLRRRSPHPQVDLSPALAASRGIVEDDAVEIRTSHGRIILRAHLDENLSDDVAIAGYGWWQGCADLGLPGYQVLGADDASYNSLTTDDGRDPISGAPSYRTTACNIARVDTGPRRWDGFRPLVVSALESQTPDVVTVAFTAPDHAQLPSFHPGQFLTLAIDEPARRDNIVRSYSLSGAVTVDQRSYRVSVKSMEDGAVSPMIARLRIGQSVLAQAPAGRFLLPLENEFPVVLLAGGIGITPFMSYLETLAGRGTRPEVHLYYVSRSGVHHAFAARIRELVAAMPDLRVTTCFSRPGPSDRPGEHYDRAGHLTLATIDPKLLQRRARFYLCGPDEMMTSLTAVLVRAGVPRFEIFQEHFASPRVLLAPAGATSHTVTFRQSGRSLIWTPDSGSVLDLAERHGIRIPTGCRVGQCESCAVPLADGLVAHSSPSQDVDTDTCLTCRAIPQSDIVIDA
ncbi:molybdopterin-dependent oxidoreductase [Bradyrhizobium sp. LHD-71]|uniref:molybdopterin-dependent oxidoreductase n=1 Tax=Bradyrhizobium sp. LHD-71 TaxID=3072141 RepID=UPI00280ED7ED|nr:molybdopterin-dependent oxidoreductase [Bradyrhizobium sp. LHD-71]MDQ8732331.1 molybdopterin-dependent oxidoreductase [Bradyrhizobium sp. LHD-71]